MDTAVEEPIAESDFSAAAANSDAPKTESEERVVKCFTALQEKELGFTVGVDFGKAVIALRDEIKKSGGRNFMERLEQLNISYAKARYWIAVVEEKPIQRGAAAGAASARAQKPNEPKPQEREPDGWQVALDKLMPLVEQIEILGGAEPEGAVVLKSTVARLAVAIGYELTEMGGSNV